MIRSDQFGAALDGAARQQIVKRNDAATEPVARFEHANVVADRAELMRGRQARESAADDQDARRRLTTSDKCGQVSTKQQPGGAGEGHLQHFASRRTVVFRSIRGAQTAKKNHGPR